MAEVNPKKVAADPTPSADALAADPVVTPDIPAESHPDDDLIKDLDAFVAAQMPDEKIVEAMKHVRKQARAMMECVIRHSPDVPRRREALRQIQITMLYTLTAMLMPVKQFEKVKEE